MAGQPRAAYVHVPFCAHRCGYCNFTVLAGRDDLFAAYLQALDRELSGLGEPHPVDTLFIGGGTPTRLRPAILAQLLTLVGQWLPARSGCEWSVEANPADVDLPRADVLAAGGVNRVSLGAQSFDAVKLRALERDHGPEQIARSVELLRPRMRSISLDLIFAAPNETLAGWQADLAAALALQPDHLSTYGLTFERGTTFWGRLSRGELRRATEELEREMYLAAIDALAVAGWEHYEVSNFARPGHRCRHNEVYWAAEEYLAFGPGAARYANGRREVNHRSATTWIKRVLAGQSPVAESETLGPEDRAREAFVLAMRRMEGVNRASFSVQTGFDLHALAGAEIERFVKLGLLADDGRQIRLTRAGLLVSDAIWPVFLRV